MALTRLLAISGVIAIASAPALAEKPKGDYRSHSAAIRAVVVNDDGTSIASADVNDTIFIWDLKSGKPMHKLALPSRTVDRGYQSYSTPERVESLAMSPDGKLIAAAMTAGALNGAVYVWDAETGKYLRSIADGVNVRGVAFSPDGKRIAHNISDKNRRGHRIEIRNAETGAIEKKLRGDRLAASLLRFTPDGTKLICAGGGKAFVWDIEKQELLHTIEAHDKAINDLVVSGDGAHFATCSEDGLIRIWKIEDGSREREIKANQKALNALAYSKSGLLLASGGDDTTIKVWKTDTGKRVNQLWAHRDPVTALVISGDGKTMVSGAKDKSVLAWRFSDREVEVEGEPVPDDDAATDEGGDKHNGGAGSGGGR
ncbi:MAG: WD40 repeat domain-containing protein [Phycisphaerales bacterium]|nr:WD40 repeat domain-containing protein [Phycisphaerales bacterium]